MRYPDGGGLTAAGRSKREAVRLQAARWLAEGKPVAEVAAGLRVSREAVYRWRKRWQAGGVKALVSKGSGGATCRLTDDQLQRLAGELDRGPAVHGFGPDQRWTLARVAELIERLFGERYTERGTSYLLHRMGFTPQVPARRAAKRDPEAIAAWWSRRWPSVRG
jgi:putative transposase